MRPVPGVDGVPRGLGLGPRAGVSVGEGESGDSSMLADGDELCLDCRSMLPITHQHDRLGVGEGGVDFADEPGSVS